MKAKLLYLILGLCLGAGVTLAFWKLYIPPEPPPAPVADEPTVRPSGKRAATPAPRPSRSQAPIAVPASAPIPADGQPSAAGATNQDWRKLIAGVMTNEAFATGVSKMMTGGLRQRLEGRLATLKLRLNLTEPQEQQLRGLIDRKLATAGDITARMIQGKGAPADQQALGALYAEAQTEMQQVLTPEQWTAYQQYTTEERQSNAERMADGELSRLQRDMQLTDEQQDQVYSVLYDQTLQQLQEMEAGGPANGDWAQSFQRRNAARKAALQSVLTPEQMQAYDKVQGMRANWMRMFTPGGAVPGGGL